MAAGLRAAQGLLDHGMASAADLEGGAVVENGPRIALARRHLGQAASQSSSASAPATSPSARSSAATAAASSAKISCSSASARSAAETIRLSVSTSSCVVKRMAPAMVWRWRKVSLSGARMHRLGGAGGHLDVVAEDIVVADLERLDAGLLHVPGFQRRHHLAAVVAQGARRVEIGGEALAHESAIALEVRRVVDQRPRQQRLQPTSQPPAARRSASVPGRSPRR